MRQAQSTRTSPAAILMIITDHLNLLGANPLTGPNEDRWGPRFVDQTEGVRSAVERRPPRCRRILRIANLEGVYAAVAGPTYETPAEIRYLRAVGADAVGMSTVPEAIVGVTWG